MICSLPKWLKRFPIYNRYERKFNAFCKEHDLAYDNKKNKFKADWDLSKSIWLCGYKTIAIITFILCTLFGWKRWLKCYWIK